MTPSLDFFSQYIDHDDEYWEEFVLMRVNNIPTEPIINGVSIAEIEPC